MPIRPENRKRYSRRWAALVAMVRARSGNRCECQGQCGIDHEGGRCAAEHRRKHPDTGNLVILTAAHYRGAPLESEDIADLFHACQRCHNRYDAPERAAGRRARARAAKLAREPVPWPDLWEPTP